MNAVVVADDLTGANDTGVQFAKKGLKTTVLLDQDTILKNDDIDVLVIETDSRSASETEAYKSVEKAIEVAKKYHVDMIYKKVDSTMRGNVGTELDSLIDHSDAKFIIIAPGYPDNQRFVKNGEIYVGESLLEHTYFARDVSTPINSSSIEKIITQSSKRKVGIISIDDIDSGKSSFQQKLLQLRKSQAEFIVCDTNSNHHFQKLIEYMDDYQEKFIWCGSAGLAEQIAERWQNKSSTIERDSLVRKGQILFVIGSVHESTREQLNYLLMQTSICGIEVNTGDIVKSKESKEIIMENALKNTVDALQKGRDVVLYTSANPEEIKASRLNGQNSHLTSVQMSDFISNSLGELVEKVIRVTNVQKSFLTGGDTAKKVAAHIKANEFYLCDEVEEGIPIGILKGEKNMITITKAGGFGTKETLFKSYKALGGE
ncbi:four-carbon acid sugar kinase family protein [Evansella halocellulosilytica]|uniref:four-carbon acid sugar kinase family protein n=1 Tax=Evansella halocellulosilytica TaxID=2011013 RepID=UPI0015C92988|nr:four-carbon acid sugar kinase family protein [Evansella halocellulosilytica]